MRIRGPDLATIAGKITETENFLADATRCTAQPGVATLARRIQRLALQRDDAFRSACIEAAWIEIQAIYREQ